MIAALRAQLPRLASRVFLNWAGTAPMLANAHDAVVRHADEGRAPMADHFEEWLATVERTRASVAGAIGARADEIALTTCTSAALSLAAGAVAWRPGDRVLYPADEFASNRFAWQNLAALGVRAEAVPIEPGVEFAAQLAARDLTGVRMLALSAVSYRDGRALDVAAVTRLARERGLLVCVDAIQAIGALPVDVRAWGADFVASGGQKWLLAPVGTGFLWIARERLPELRVPLVGWASSRHAGDDDTPALEFAEGAARFEPGLPDVAALAGLGASVDTLAALGWPAVFAAVATNRARLAEAFAVRGVRVVHDGAPGATSGIVTVELPGGALDALRAACGRQRIDATWRRGTARFAAHACTNDDDFAALGRALDEALGAARTAPVAVPHPAPAAAPAAPATAAGAWRRALVTGASRGLGAAIASALAAEGCELVLLARDAAALEAVAAPLRSSVRVVLATVDLADDAALAAWITRNAEALAGCDLLVNAAARADAEPFADSDAQRERDAFQVNALAPMRLARAVLPGMRSRGRGAVLNVATTGARNALPLFSAYAASKAALWAWSESLGRELAGTGVTVTTFVPPHMDSATRRQLGRRAIAHYDTSGAQDATVPAERVARAALAAARAGRPLAASRGVRLQHALNALWPARVAREVAKRWRGTAGR